MLNKTNFDELARAEGDVLVSTYVATHRRGAESHGDPIRLKNALAEAATRGHEQGIDRKRMDALLAPGERLLADERFWQHQGDGLALFFGAGGMREFRLSHAVEDLVLVNRRYCLRPILPAVSVGERYHVLALSQNRVRLISCSRTSARELDLHDIPRSLADVVGYDWEQKSLQFHSTSSSGGQRGVTFHGHGAANDSDKEELARFVRRVDDGIIRLLGNTDAPLVLAAVQFVAAAYREHSRHGGLVPQTLEGSPDRSNARELRERTWPLVEERFHAERKRALAAVEAGLAAGRVMTDVGAALRDARDGRVGTLLVRASEPVWGKSNGSDGTVEMHARREPGDDDRLDLCVAHALRTGAAVHAVPAAELPHGGPLAAVRRF
jgi:hypothetical protein